jgi:hypothetical protein
MIATRATKPAIIQARRVFLRQLGLEAEGEPLTISVWEERRHTWVSVPAAERVD